MKPKIIILVMVLIIITVIFSGCAPSADPAVNDASAAAPASQSLDGKALMETQCSKCHGLDRVTSQSKTETEWTSTVDRMIGKGAELNDAERAAVIGYLSENYK